MKSRKAIKTTNGITNDGPTDKELADAATKIEEVATALIAQQKALTPAERMALAKPGAAAERVVPKIVEIARRKGIAIPGVDLDLTEAQLAEAQRFEPLEAQAEMLTAGLADRVLHAKSDAWVRATIIYGVLSQVARSDANLARELEPIRAFFTKKRNLKSRAQSEAAPPAPAAAVKGAAA